MKVLFGINSWGLGHATRSYPLIEALIKRRHEVWIASSNRALKFMKNELGSKIKYFELPEYPYQDRAYRRDKFSTLGYLLNFPKYQKSFNKENKLIKNLHSEQKFGCVISDSRYGVHLPDVPSYLIHSHIRVGLGKLSFISRIITEIGNLTFLKNYSRLLIPDEEKNGVCGPMTHDLLFIRDPVYLGLLSMVKKRKIKSDLDYFFSVSGPEPQRTVFEKKVLSSLKNLKGKMAVALGKPESQKIEKKKNYVVYGYLKRKKQEEMLNRAKMIITRSGPTTITDIVELGKKALLVPTLGHPEQEDVAEYHHKKRQFMKKALDDLDLAKDLKEAEKYKGYVSLSTTRKSVKRFLEVTGL